VLASKGAFMATKADATTGDMIHKLSDHDHASSDHDHASASRGGF